MRWFYRDPLAAAWMAKHFGMKLVSEDHTDSDPEELSTAYMEGFEARGPYYIHPDSLHLLEPQVGDVLNRYDLDSTFERNRMRQVFGTDDAAMLSARLQLAAGWKLISRGGVVFHWPEEA